MASNIGAVVTNFQMMNETLDIAKTEWANKFDSINGGIMHDRKALQDSVGQINDLANKVSMLIDDVGKLKKVATRPTSKDTPAGSPAAPDLVGLKSLSGVTVYSGEAGKYTNWACKLRSAVSGK